VPELSRFITKQGDITSACQRSLFRRAYYLEFRDAVLKNLSSLRGAPGVHAASLRASILHEDTTFGFRVAYEFNLEKSKSDQVLVALAHLFQTTNRPVKSGDLYLQAFHRSPFSLTKGDYERLITTLSDTARFKECRVVLSHLLKSFPNDLEWKIYAVLFQIGTSHLHRLDRSNLLGNLAYLRKRASTATQHFLLSRAIYKSGNIVEYVDEINRAIYKRLCADSPRRVVTQRSFASKACLECMVFLSSYMERYGFTSFAVFGTLLGLHRDGELMPYDKDGDLGVYIDDYDRFRETLLRLCKEHTHFIAPTMLLQGKEATSYNVGVMDASRGVSVDFFVFSDHEMNSSSCGIYTECGLLTWRFSKFRLSKLQFNSEVRLWAPTEPERFLMEAYGESWTERIEVWDSTINCPNLSTESREAAWYFGTQRLYDAIDKGRTAKIRNYFETLLDRWQFPFTDEVTELITTKLERST
jgi:hypothetical protein